MEVIVHKQPQKYKIKAVISGIPAYVVYLIDKAFFNSFISKNNYSFISFTLVIIWICIVVSLILKQDKEDGTNSFEFTKIIQFTLGVALTLMTTYVMYTELNRMPSLMLNAIYGKQQTVTFNINKSKSYTQPSRTLRKGRSCNGDDAIQILDGKHYQLISCQIDPYYLNIPYGRFKMKFNAIDSKYGTYLLNPNPLFAS